MVKYEDVINPFPHCQYHINTTLDFLFQQLDSWNDGKVYKLELEPDFQRVHVWTEEQQIRFMEFLVRDPQDSKAKSILFNCRNWRYEHNEKDGNTIYLVDGLQRLTAIRRFINNEIPVYGYYLKDFEKPLFMRRIHMDIYVNSLNRKDMLKWYIDLNDGGTVHTKEEIHKVKELLEKES